MIAHHAGIVFSQLALLPRARRRRLRFTGLVLVGSLLSSGTAHADAPLQCVTGLVLGVQESSASDVVAAVCRSARAAEFAGMLRVSVVLVENKIAITATRVDTSSGFEQSARLDASSIEQAVHEAPLL